jgi:hypothetical protein
LIAGEEEFAFIETTLRTALTDASREFARNHGSPRHSGEGAPVTVR